MTDFENKNLTNARQSNDRWQIYVLDGPNMPNLGRRDPKIFGKIESIAALQKLVQEFGNSLGVDIHTFASNSEGALLEKVHETAQSAHGYIVNPGGLTSVSEGWRHALQETKKPVVEVHFHNLFAHGEVSLFSSSAIASVTGFREHSYVAAVLGLVLSLDDRNFLNPHAEDNGINRTTGTPYSYKK